MKTISILFPASKSVTPKSRSGVPGFDTARDDSTFILPGVTLSYALNNRISVDGMNTTAATSIMETTVTGLLWARVALLQQLSQRRCLRRGTRFAGISAGFSFHY
jgi:hypothetical protein